MEQDPLAQFPVAPAWAQNVGEAGKLSVYLALAFFILSLTFFAFSAKRPVFGKAATLGFWLGSAALAGSFGCLISLFVNNQFQFEYVFARADIHTELKYKVAGVWSGQQGSFMLWGVGAAIFGVLSLRSAGPYRPAYGAVFSVFLGTLAAILAYETPFNVMKEVISNGVIHQPPTGNGMVPSLQNYWIVIHPPVIFLGFGSLTIPFAFAVAAILHRDLEGWASRVRPWALVSTALLALGICMGGFWAYETLGWGGFWMWDPVENASFVPWLMVAALVHGLIVQVSRKRWHGTNLWLAAAPFFAFLYGTYLTRSGVLGETSVHSFANMNRTALNILIGFSATSFLGFTGLYLWRGRKLALAANADRGDLQPANRESMYGLGVVLLSLFGLVLAIGMSWPFFTFLAGKGQSKVEEPLFHKIVVWFFIPLILLIGAAPFVTWRGMGWKTLAARLVNVLSASIGTVGVLLFALRFPEWGLPGLGDKTVSMPFGWRMAAVPWVAILLTLCLFAAFGNLWRLVETMKRSRSSAGAFVSHFGLAMLLAGLIGSRGFEREERTIMRPSQPASVLGYTVKYKELTGKNLYDRDAKLLLDVTAPNGEKFEAKPGLFYRQNMRGGDDEAFQWPYVHQGLAHDVYLAIGAPIMYAWPGEGVWFKPGETNTVNGIQVTYEKMVTEGTPGTPDAKFGAQIKVVLPGDEDHPAQTYRVTPKLAIQGMTPEMPFVGADFRAVMYRIEAKDKSVQLQMLYSEPLFQINMYTKPLTTLVWAGTGILFIGGLLSAAARRRPRPVVVEEEENLVSPDAKERKPTSKDAPIPAT